jgi:hypothetical protein
LFDVLNVKSLGLKKDDLNTS